MLNYAEKEGFVTGIRVYLNIFLLHATSSCQPWMSYPFLPSLLVFRLFRADLDLLYHLLHLERQEIV